MSGKEGWLKPDGKDGPEGGGVLKLKKLLVEKKEVGKELGAMGKTNWLKEEYGEETVE